MSLTEREQLTSIGLKEGILNERDAEHINISMLRVIMSPNGVQCLKKGFFTMEDVNTLDMPIIRELVSNRGFQALSEGLFSIQHVGQLGLAEFREILTPAIIKRLRNKQVTIEDLIKFDLKALRELASTPEKIEPEFQTSLEKYNLKHKASNHPLRIILGMDDHLNSNGLQNLDILCSIDEQERELRTNTNVRGFIGTLHRDALRAASNIDYLFTLGGLALLERYNSATPKEQETIIKALNEYHKDPEVLADKAIEGFYDYLDHSLKQVRGISVKQERSYDEIVQDQKKVLFGSNPKINPGNFQEIKKTSSFNSIPNNTIHGDSPVSTSSTSKASIDEPNPSPSSKVDVDVLFDVLKQMINEKCVFFHQEGKYNEAFFNDICKKLNISFQKVAPPKREALFGALFYAKLTNVDTLALKEYFKSETNFDYEEYTALKSKPGMTDDVLLKNIQKIQDNENVICNSSAEAEQFRWILKTAKIEHSEKQLGFLEQQHGDIWLSATIKDSDKDNKLGELYLKLTGNTLPDRQLPRNSRPDAKI